MTAPGAYGVTASDFASRAAAQSSTTGLAKTALGKDDFLAILVAQLKNQDPMSPMQGTEFATQLAQFSNVEQLINISGKMDAQAASSLQNQITSQTALGASLIGREISFAGNQVQVYDGQDTTLHFDLKGSAAKVNIEIIDEKGKVVFAEEKTNLAEGAQRLKFDTADLKAGSYTYKVTATTGDKSAVGVTQYGTAVVSGVSFQNGQIMLHVGQKVLPLLEIAEILAVPPAAKATSTTTTGSSNS